MRHEADIRVPGSALGADPNTVAAGIDAGNATRQTARIRPGDAKAEKDISLAVRGQRCVDENSTVITGGIGVVIGDVVEGDMSDGGRSRAIGIIQVIESPAGTREIEP